MLTVIPGLFKAEAASLKRRRYWELAAELRHIAETLERYLKIAKGRLTGFDFSEKMTLSQLEIAYFHGTGREATHSSHKDGEHVAEPRSEFGRFVSAFFAQVDPSVTQTSLTTKIRKFVADPDYKKAMQESRGG
ncbi:hypothetical protein ACRAQ7_06515 [Erythrobacter sp. W53]|uniref:hypothetical protein n=1 Tax=Erythrobacter sp. W53 TaxID=3425947 RepID=UPI003D766ED2